MNLLDQVVTPRGQILVSRTDDNPLPAPCVRSKRPPCLDSKRHRVYRHHAHMLKSMCPAYTGRFECTHGGVLSLHTGVFSVPTTRHTPHTHNNTQPHTATHTTHKHTQTHTNTHNTQRHTPHHTEKEDRERLRGREKRKKTETEREEPTKEKLRQDEGEDEREEDRNHDVD